MVIIFKPFYFPNSLFHLQYSHTRGKRYLKCALLNFVFHLYFINIIQTINGATEICQHIINNQSPLM